MIGAAISFYTQHYVDAVAIAVIVLINAIISFMQEYRAAQSLAALKDMAAPLAMVKRDGTWVELPAVDIVPGDVLRFKAGDIIAADVRFTDAARLAVDEAALTGESEPVDKHTLPIDDENIVLADRLNMGFMSTKVTNGTGEGIVTATGMQTEHPVRLTFHSLVNELRRSFVEPVLQSGHHTTLQLGVVTVYGFETVSRSVGPCCC